MLDMEDNGRSIYDKGMEIGESNKALSYIQILMDKHFSFSQIADLLNFNEEEQKKYRSLLNQE